MNKKPLHPAAQKALERLKKNRPECLCDHENCDELQTITGYCPSHNKYHK